jgi:hypothetical protein
MIEAIAKLSSLEGLDALCRKAWAGVAAGQVSEETAQAVAEAAEARRQAIRERFASKPASGLPRGLKPPRRPDREASIRRRRTLAASGMIPAAIAARFTLGECAALTVIAIEVMRHERCTLTLGHIAALAGVSRTTAQNAFRIAARLGFIRVTERRSSGWRNDSNEIHVTDASWTGWIAWRGRVQKNKYHVELTEKKRKNVEKTDPHPPYVIASGGSSWQNQASQIIKGRPHGRQCRSQPSGSR